MTRFTDFDFGITWLASWFHHDWRNMGCLADVLDNALWEGVDSRNVELLHRDAILMRNELNSPDIESLWKNAIDGGFSYDEEVSSGWELMEYIRARCSDWYAESGPPTLAEADIYSGYMHSEDVIAEISLIWSRREDVNRSLTRCARFCTPDLAFRFLLKTISSHGCHITESQYARFLQLGSALYYGEFLVSNIEYLVD